MSPSLQAEVSWYVHRKWLARVWFLHGAPSAFLVQLARRMRPLVLAPAEVAPNNQLYIIHRGLALYGGRVLHAGQVWGEDACILHSESLRSKNSARAITFIECFCIDAADMDHVLPAFVEFRAQLRQRAIRLAARRAFVVAAELKKQVRESDSARASGSGDQPAQLVSQSTQNLGTSLTSGHMPSFADISAATAQHWKRPNGSVHSQVEALTDTLTEKLAELHAVTRKLAEQVAPLPAAIQSLAQGQQLIRDEMNDLKETVDAALESNSSPA